MKERGISPPDWQRMRLKPAAKKMRRRIIESCKLSGVNLSLVYWYAEIDNEILVYVCQVEDVAKYKVITAFKYSK